MMYDRHFFETFDGHLDLHLCADSSPQAGRNILCAREESFITSRQQLLYGSVVGNFSFVSRRLPPSFLSLGHAAFADVTHRLVNSMVLVSGTAVDMYRGSVRTWLGDQSKESKFGDSAAEVLCLVCSEHQFSSAMPGDAEFLLPDCMTIYDHLHIFQNALAAAIESLDWWASFREILVAFVSLFGTREHLERFLAHCPIPAWVKRQIRKFKQRVVSWRWELLEDVLLDLDDMWHAVAYFKLDLMLGGSKVGNAVYILIAQGAVDPLFCARRVLLRVICCRVGHWTRWLEGCPCHEQLLVNCSTWDQRKAILTNAGCADGI